MGTDSPYRDLGGHCGANRDLRRLRSMSCRHLRPTSHGSHPVLSWKLFIVTSAYGSIHHVEMSSPCLVAAWNTPLCERQCPPLCTTCWLEPVYTLFIARAITTRYDILGRIKKHHSYATLTQTRFAGKERPKATLSRIHRPQTVVN